MRPSPPHWRRAGVGVDNIDVKAATAKKVQVINTPQGNAIAAGELAVAYIFALARKLPQSTASMKKAGAMTTTSALRGAVRDDPSTRQEFLSLVG